LTVGAAGDAGCFVTSGSTVRHKRAALARRASGRAGRYTWLGTAVGLWPRCSQYSRATGPNTTVR